MARWFPSDGLLAELVCVFSYRSFVAAAVRRYRGRCECGSRSLELVRFTIWQLIALSHATIANGNVVA